MWYNYAILLLAFMSIVLQIRSSRLECRSCTIVKYIYIVGLCLSMLFVVFMEMLYESEFGYAMALVMVLFHLVLGTVYRIGYLTSEKRNRGH